MPTDGKASGSSLPSVDLLVVTANPAVSLSLRERDIEAVHPSRFSAWLRSSDRPTPRGIVLDPGSPPTARKDLDALRGHRVTAPVLLVTDDSEGWLDLTDEGVIQLGPPLTCAALRDAVERLLDRPPVAAAPPTRSRRWALASELAARLKALDPDPVQAPSPPMIERETPTSGTSRSAATGIQPPRAAVEPPAPTVAVTAEPDVVQPHPTDRPPARTRNAPEPEPREPDAPEPTLPRRVSPDRRTDERRAPQRRVGVPATPGHGKDDVGIAATDSTPPPVPDTPARPAPDASPTRVREVPSVLGSRPTRTSASDHLGEGRPAPAPAAAGPGGSGGSGNPPAAVAATGAATPTPWSSDEGVNTDRRARLALVGEGRLDDENGANGHPGPPHREKPGRRNTRVSVAKARRINRTAAAATAAPPVQGPDELMSDASAELPGGRPDAAVVEAPAPAVVDRGRSHVVDRSAHPVAHPPVPPAVDLYTQPLAHHAARSGADPAPAELVETTSPDVLDANRGVVGRSDREVVDRPQRDGEPATPDSAGRVAPPTTPSATVAQRVPQRDVRQLVRELLERSDELFVYHLGVVAQAIVEDVTESLPADAACVLVRDEDGRWHVEGALGLRKAETRLALDDDHWIVAQTVRSSAAVAIEDTDIARVQLRGAPLASWPHLMAEGTPDGRALVIAARDGSGEGFSERDVVRIADLCHEGQRYLAAGQELRTLARRLSED